MTKLQTSASILASRPRSGDSTTEKAIRSVRGAYSGRAMHAMGYGPESGPETDCPEGSMTRAVAECNK